MAIQTTLQQLEEVQAAISKVLKAQEAGTGGDRLVRADLDALTRREKDLKAQYKSEQGTGLAFNNGIRRRSY